MQAPGVVIELLVRDALRAFFGLAQMQHDAFIVLREVPQPQFFDELSDQRLRLGPKPGRTEVEAAPLAARDCENAPADPVASLEDCNFTPALMKPSRQRQTA